jgi:hypothetical protein
MRDVDAGALDADHQRRGDLAVGVATGHEAEDLGLARRQPQQLLEPGTLVGRLARRCEIQPRALGEPLDLLPERPRAQPLRDGVGQPDRESGVSRGRAVSAAEAPAATSASAWRQRQ